MQRVEGKGAFPAHGADPDVCADSPATVLALTVVPVLASLCLPHKTFAAHESWIVHRLARLSIDRCLERVLAHARIVSRRAPSLVLLAAHAVLS